LCKLFAAEKLKVFYQFLMVKGLQEMYLASSKNFLDVKNPNSIRLFIDQHLTEAEGKPELLSLSSLSWNLMEDNYVEYLERKTCKSIAPFKFFKINYSQSLAEDFLSKNLDFACGPPEQIDSTKMMDLDFETVLSTKPEHRKEVVLGLVLKVRGSADSLAVTEIFRQAEEAVQNLIATDSDRVDNPESILIVIWNRIQQIQNEHFEVIEDGS
jgi:hypothetical protein